VVGVLASASTCAGEMLVAQTVFYAAVLYVRTLPVIAGVEFWAEGKIFLLRFFASGNPRFDLEAI
jgi:hypothetical protein